MPRWNLSKRERFVQKIRRDPDTGCWMWTGNVACHGYGHFKVKGKQKKAHRVAYELFKGKIGKGLDIDHLCSERSCVNPDHLEAVTAKENVRRTVERGHHKQASQTHCIRGHPLSGDNLYTYPSGTRMCRICHREKSNGARRLRRAIGGPCSSVG